MRKTLEQRFAWMRERQAQDAASVAIEQPLTAKEAAPLWGQSAKATREYFAKVQGVRVIGNPRRFDRKLNRWVRKYDTVLIPPSVLQREIQKITNT